VGNCCG
jgi:hypothetical protein